MSPSAVGVLPLAFPLFRVLPTPYSSYIFPFFLTSLYLTFDPFLFMPYPLPSMHSCSPLLLLVLTPSARSYSFVTSTVTLQLPLVSL